MNIENDNKFNLTLILNGALVGLITGVAIQLFKFFVDGISGYRTLWISQTSHNPYYKVLTFLVLLLIGFIVGKMVKNEPSIGGSGISEATSYVNKPKEMNQRKNFIMKYIGSILVLGSGLTAGRVGPSVHFGTMMGVEVGKRNGLGQEYTTLMVLGGIASGICSIFNAPLAGIIFVLEIITDKADRNVLTVLLSSVATSYFFINLFENPPAFALQNMQDLPLKHYGLLLVLIVVSILFTKLFIFLFYKTFVILDKIPLKSEYIAIIPFALTGLLYYANANFIGFEHDLFMNLEVNLLVNSAWVIIMYFAVKLLLTLITFGSRIPGGLFYPVIFVGAVWGLIVFRTSYMVFGVEAYYMINFAALGIVAILTGVYKAPLTATLLIIELTGNFMNLVPVVLTALLVQIGTDFLDVEPVHNLLVRYKR